MIAPPLQAVTSAAPASQPAASSAGAFLRVPSHWPGQGDLLDWCQSISPLASTVLVIAGLIYLAYGWKAFKGLVTLNAAFVGAFIGALLGQRGGNWFGGACVGARQAYPGRPPVPRIGPPIGYVAQRAGVCPAGDARETRAVRLPSGNA